MFTVRTAFGITFSSKQLHCALQRCRVQCYAEHRWWTLEITFSNQLLSTSSIEIASPSGLRLRRFLCGQFVFTFTRRRPLPTSRSECDPAGSAAIASYADALSRHVSSTRLAAVQQNVSEAAADSSDCDLARYAKQIPIELIGKPVLDADRLNPRERVARVPDAPLTLGVRAQVRPPISREEDVIPRASRWPPRRAGPFGSFRSRTVFFRNRACRRSAPVRGRC
jgi:hypothetical protein